MTDKHAPHQTPAKRKKPVNDEQQIVAERGEVESIIISAKDIMERWPAEQETQDANRQKTIILESITDAFFALDKTWHIIYMNKQAEVLLMMKRDELVGRDFWEVFPEAVDTAFYDQYHKAVEENVAVEVVEFYPPHDRWYEVHAYPSEEGLAIYFRDINERKRAEEALRQSEENFHLLADAMPQIVWTARQDGWRDYYNQKWFEYTGMTLEQTQGRGWESALHPDDLQKCREAWTHSIETGESYQVEPRFKGAIDGVYRWHLTRALPIRGSNGTIIKWFGTCTDINDRKLTEDELRLSEARLQKLARELEIRSRAQKRMNAELRHKHDELTQLNAALEVANRTRNQFLSTMSHELRTPLASIIGFGQLALEEAEQEHMSQKQHNNLKRILNNGYHLLGLINDVLDLSKMEAGRMLVNYSQVDVRDLLNSVVQETQSIAIAQHLNLKTEVAKGVGSLESDPLKLRQILLNLVFNAIKFTEQGEVTVSARGVTASDRQAERIAIVVKDSGVGIPEDIQEHIFEAFYQADGSYTRKIGGTGLGLSIVSQLTALLGGMIEVESTAGKGSTFTVMLPVKAVHQYVERDIPRLHSAPQGEIFTALPSSEGLSPVIPHGTFAVSAIGEVTNGRNKLVLVVDDNPDMMVIIEEALKHTPYTVVGVQDSSKVMELVQVLHPCAIMLDVMMPDVNGWQLLHQLKINAATAAIPVVMISVLSEAAAGYVLGADAYLIKPFKTDIMLNTLLHLIASPESPPQVGPREAQEV